MLSILANSILLLSFSLKTCTQKKSIKNQLNLNPTCLDCGRNWSNQRKRSRKNTQHSHIKAKRLQPGLPSVRRRLRGTRRLLLKTLGPVNVYTEMIQMFSNMGGSPEMWVKEVKMVVLQEDGTKWFWLNSWINAHGMMQTDFAKWMLNIFHTVQEWRHTHVHPHRHSNAHTPTPSCSYDVSSSCCFHRRELPIVRRQAYYL